MYTFSLSFPLLWISLKWCGIWKQIHPNGSMTTVFSGDVFNDKMAMVLFLILVRNEMRLSNTLSIRKSIMPREVSKRNTRSFFKNSMSRLTRTICLISSIDCFALTGLFWNQYLLLLPYLRSYGANQLLMEAPAGREYGSMVANVLTKSFFSPPKAGRHLLFY